MSIDLDALAHLLDEGWPFEEALQGAQMPSDDTSEGALS